MQLLYLLLANSKTKRRNFLPCRVYVGSPLPPLSLSLSLSPCHLLDFSTRNRRDTRPSFLLCEKRKMPARGWWEGAKEHLKNTSRHLSRLHFIAKDDWKPLSLLKRRMNPMEKFIFSPIVTRPWFLGAREG